MAGLRVTRWTCRLASAEWRLTSADEVFAAIAMGGVRTAAVLRAQTPDAIAQIRESVRHGVESYWTNEGAFEVPMLSVLASAKKH